MLGGPLYQLVRRAWFTVRFLLTLPLLIVAELVIHQPMRPVIRQFLLQVVF